MKLGRFSFSASTAGTGGHSRTQEKQEESMEGSNALTQELQSWKDRPYSNKFIRNSVIPTGQHT
ncbi:hypothetical protein KY290_006334 [Solanum tuberosum]|uniref:Uncharacterized protein n=1 Tax=Solanum tuberosum TaxID=4113 RepID=A0ABQ7WGQ3_SOLTU|nr:hypothetical protein KY284_006374 [Solanum tuberosum]KAH0723663.1 hypothetical protein KY289_006707 [Solanum tuberosum]KAH0751300.1 hypothetical protein KY285_004448 [Solanum tuberosum]KAH0779907.1 hypothetical protein KY290_006334 [Solanum tuberosum]